MWTKFKKTIKNRIIKPFIESHSPVSELAMASAVGLFWAFTPLVGVQMVIITFNWFLFHFLRWHFYLTGALSLVWISNPLTMGPMYFGFYLCGFFLLEELGQPAKVISFQEFSRVLDSANQMDLWSGLLTWLQYIYDFLLWPMIVGSMIVAPLVAAIGYFLTIYMVNYYRRHKANGLGLTLEQWESQYVRNIRS